jgi:hypothetical protein
MYRWAQSEYILSLKVAVSLKKVPTLPAVGNAASCILFFNVEIRHI